MFLDRVLLLMSAGDLDFSKLLTHVRTFDLILRLICFVLFYMCCVCNERVSISVLVYRMFYGPGGPYALFAGKDASRALAKMSFEEKDLTWDISGLGPFELEALQDWEYKFNSKYATVGTVKVTVSEAETASVSEPAETDDGDAHVTKQEPTVVDKNLETPAESDVKNE